MSVTCPACLTENLETSIACTICGYTLSSEQSSHHLPPNTLLKQNQYRIEKTLGEGGFGITYKGIDLKNSREVAIKENWPEKSSRVGKTVVWSPLISPKDINEQLAKFIAEAQVISKCQHPNIVKVYDYFPENNTAYIVMEFLKGQSLYDILKTEKRLPEARVKKYLIEITQALKVIHENQLLHRDIKPENIMIDQQDRAVLIDFGNAREFIANKTKRMTQTLTRGYAPIEQYSETGRRGPSTDLYALCASMYELLTGELPPEAIDRLHTDTLKPPRQIVPSLDPTTEKVILMGLRMRVEERFQTADELIDALQGKFVSPSLRRARQFANEQKLSEAVDAYQKCLTHEPNNGEAAVELAMVLSYLDDHQAEIVAQKAISLQPKDGRGYGVLGLINCRKSNWSEALRYLQTAANLSPYEAWIQANLAWALGKSNHWQQAETSINQAIQLDSESAFTLGLQAWISVNQQQWKPAIRYGRQAIFKSKQSNQSQQLQRWVYPCLIVALDKAVVTQQATDVERCVQECITQVPDSSFAWGFKGWKQGLQGLWTDAVSSFEKASRLSPAPHWTVQNFGIASEQIKDLSKAIQTYETSSQKLPPDAFTLFRLATVLGQQGQWRQARSLLEKAIQLKPDYAEAYHNLGWVLLNLKTSDSQVEHPREMWSAYRKAVELYGQQQNYSVAGKIKQVFQAIDVEM
ncbi:Serine/threonine-protein kinase PrkC [Planktothrix tepida]|uniref:Serine/Threonine protein kinase with TPR repeats n=1 Tax=Planktothrix tepida PCC 9214 TaxID=671072 RepID=A0A1J1LUC2_9CYAN|nr:serine/threonine-protein kinase [Planktothrix tepida]CAD5989249.1 Serine/threonine-protein kinase PrkC [Planktothrix tepida]CUR35444.1 Serine/Threonine protein kinase with TPR repeats [Planktothrix tepida PCC 9214]